jgi:hypothetical protein
VAGAALERHADVALAIGAGEDDDGGFHDADLGVRSGGLRRGDAIT